MLNVQLGKGTLELQSVLLNTAYLNDQLVRVALVCRKLFASD